MPMAVNFFCPEVIFLNFSNHVLLQRCVGLFFNGANSKVQHLKKAFSLKPFILKVFAANKEFTPFSFCIKKNNKGDCASRKNTC